MGPDSHYRVDKLSLQHQVDDQWGAYLAGVEQRTGVASGDIEHEIMTLRKKFRIEQGTCEARGKTIKSLESIQKKQDDKHEKELARMQKQLETAQSEVKKVERKLWNAK